MLASALLGLDPPEAPVARLVRLAALFGVSENRARVALSRMLASGEASTDGAGRYRLEGALLERQSRQRLSVDGPGDRWDGTWLVVVNTAPLGTAAERAGRRAALERARLGELREGVWMRPANVPVQLPERLEGDSARICGVPDGDQRRLVTQLWALDDWAVRAGELLAEMDELAPDAVDSLADGFVLSASVLRHLQADPLMPSQLLPSGWPGDRLRERHHSWDRRYRRHLGEWYRATE